MNSNKSRESILAFSLIFLCLASLIVGLFTLNKSSKASNEEKELKLVDKLIGDRVSVIALEGLIFDSMRSKTPFSSFQNAANAKRLLNNALEDSNIKAVLLRMNSPGGTVATSQELYALVAELKAASKPVLVSMGDSCASGCYYIASAANKIIANSGTLTGSIGVISQGVNYKGLFDKLGIVDQTFKAGKFKDLGSGQRNLSFEEKQILDALLADSYDQFLDDIETGRGIERKKLNQIAEGLVYTGRQALAVGLVDELGTYNDAKNSMRQLLKEQGFEKADSIRFDESWNKSKISGLDDIFEFGINNSMQNSINALLSGLFKPSHSQTPFLESEFQLLWLMR